MCQEHYKYLFNLIRLYFLFVGMYIYVCAVRRRQYGLLQEKLVQLCMRMGGWICFIWCCTVHKRRKQQVEEIKDWNWCVKIDVDKNPYYSIKSDCIARDVILFISKLINRVARMCTLIFITLNSWHYHRMIIICLRLNDHENKHSFFVVAFVFIV